MKIAMFVSALGVGVSSLLATPALACPSTIPMQTVFLFDQSGSMAGAGSSSAPKWQIARDKAINDYLSLPTGTIVAIAGFDNASSVPPGDTPYYHRVVNLVENKVRGVDDAFLLGKISDTAADLGNLTPLAGAVCDGLDDIWLFTPGGDPTCSITVRRDLYLYSDGLENSTPATHSCYSATSSVAPFDATKAGMGFGLDPGSWQRKVANKAYNNNPNLDFIDIPSFLRPVVNISLLFDFVPSASARSSVLPSEVDFGRGPHANAILSSALDSNGVAFFKGLSTVSFGSYFEAKQINGVVTKIPMPGDTNPEPTLSCVDQLDLNRIVEVFGRTVRNNDPQFSGAELARRDVNNDLVIDIKDYSLATQNFGKCR